MTLVVFQPLKCKCDDNHILNRMLNIKPNLLMCLLLFGSNFCRNSLQLKIILMKCFKLMPMVLLAHSMTCIDVELSNGFLMIR